MNSAVPLLRLAPDTGHNPEWTMPAVPERYRVSQRIYYFDAEPGNGQIGAVRASVAALVGQGHGWRYAVGAIGPVGSYDIAFGDVDSEDEAMAAADRAARAFLNNPLPPPPPAPPIPQLDLVDPAVRSRSPIDFIKDRLVVLREYADRVHNSDFDPDGMLAALARTVEDVHYLVDLVGELQTDLGDVADELGSLKADLAAGNASDGYHTHGELYEQRMLLNAHLAQRWYSEGVRIVKSRRHHTGEECLGGGWFIVVMELPTGQVSFHYPERVWDLFRVPEQELAPQWDGHSSQVAIERMHQAIALFPANPKMAQRHCGNSDAHEPHYATVSLVTWCPAQARP